MNCEQAREQLGPYLDGEAPPGLVDQLEAHLAECGACRAELESLRSLAAGLAAPAGVSAPVELWTAIERRLEAGHTPAAGTPGVSRVWARPVRLAIAASVVFAVGLTGYTLVWNAPPAQASSVNFGVLLDALPLDAREAFRKFLVLYHAEESSPVEAKRYGPALNFELPDVLPGGYRREAVFLLRFGHHPGIAATYSRDGDFLGVIFHPPVQQEDFGTHRDYPCVIGKHRGHKVEVGEWRLVHLTDPTTCHCVLSRLNEQTELPPVMAALAPRCGCGCGMINGP